eukprot:1911102-Prorocentrum_lima.AAC.1
MLSSWRTERRTRGPEVGVPALGGMERHKKKEEDILTLRSLGRHHQVLQRGKNTIRGDGNPTG